MELQRIFPWRKRHHPQQVEPAHPAQSLQQAMNEFFDGFFHDRWPLATGGGRFVPTFEVSEDKAAYHVSAELPGVDQEHIELTLDHGLLTLRGEKRDTRETKEKDYYLTERSYGRFQRSIQLPTDADEDKISASFKKGVLEVVIPKSPEAKPGVKKVDVTSA